ncbi:MAG: hypothetical protein M3376_12415 [Actinomycetota bacterium]|nr:hypothetical protein [Actinomycetota bacterium]
MSFIVYFLILAFAGSLIGALAYTLFPGGARDAMVGAILNSMVITVVLGAFAAFFFEAPQGEGLALAGILSPVFVYFSGRGDGGGHSWGSSTYRGDSGGCGSGGGGGDGGGGGGGGC